LDSVGLTWIIQGKKLRFRKDYYHQNGVGTITPGLKTNQLGLWWLIKDTFGLSLALKFYFPEISNSFWGTFWVNNPGRGFKVPLGYFQRKQGNEFKIFWGKIGFPLNLYLPLGLGSLGRVPILWVIHRGGLSTLLHLGSPFHRVFTHMWEHINLGRVQYTLGSPLGPEGREKGTHLWVIISAFGGILPLFWP